MINLKEIFLKYSDEYIEFESVENKLHSRPDVCAFLLLDKLLPNAEWCMICTAWDGEIFLDVDCEELSKVATEEDVLMLIRCGVSYNAHKECLYMLV